MNSFETKCPAQQQQQSRLLRLKKASSLPHAVKDRVFIEGAEDESFSSSMKDSGIDSANYSELDLKDRDSISILPSTSKKDLSIVVSNEIESAHDTVQTFPSAEKSNSHQGADDSHENESPPIRKTLLSAIEEVKKLKNLKATLRQHYYPEGGWGFVIIIAAVLVQIIIHGFQLSFNGFLTSSTLSHSPGSTTLQWSKKPPPAEAKIHSGWLGAMSTSVSLLISPFTIAVCRLKSTRLTAVLGGLITALGCLFTSFASQFHQLFFSYGTMVGIGVGMSRDPTTLMVGQYFKRKRELMEIFLVSGSGVGLSIMSYFIKFAIGRIGWRLGLQALTGILFLSFFLGIFYRSASLYHPQRRAILHLKSQKRKIKNKDKEKHNITIGNRIIDDNPPFLDFSSLRSRTVQIILLSISISSFGLNVPIYFLIQQAFLEGIRGHLLDLLQIYLGLAWTIGCVVCGIFIVMSTKECRVPRQYLCQGSLFLTGLSMFSLLAIEGYLGYVFFVWTYGVCIGAYNYTLKMYIYEKVRARNFARAWGFTQFAMALPNIIGVPISGYINSYYGKRYGYILSAVSVMIGSLVMVAINFHRRNLRKRHRKRYHRSTKKVALSESVSIVKGIIGDTSEIKIPFDQDDDFGRGGSKASGGAVRIKERKVSFTDDHDDEIESPIALLQNSITINDILALQKKRNSSSQQKDRSGLNDIDFDDEEEGVADMDLPDELFDMEDFEEFLLDNITSCDKVENHLVLSEYEQNLILENGALNNSSNSEMSSFVAPTVKRKWSLFRQNPNIHLDNTPIDSYYHRPATPLSQHGGSVRYHSPKRSISIINEASV
uniref:Monocarboxylate transporter 10like [Acyrthosiphon pisum] n=1 Tax=Lepeophtheirus salmonis TaxID=72036 RepID=A0A0K2TXY6_LEPSM